VPLSARPCRGQLLNTSPEKFSQGVPAKNQLVDTNVLVRFFTGDPAELASRARRLIARADAGELVLVVLPVVVAGTFYTLESFYEIERKRVASKLANLLQCRGIQAVEAGRVLDALNRCEKRAAHFADAYLAAAAVELKHPIASFDRDFDRFADVRRIEPRGG
jgi:predicted nucleic acid-binding protein